VGAGERSDAFLLTVFILEALRMPLAGGLVSAVALPLYQQRSVDLQTRWLGGMAFQT
jgi:peptidoglycan biosynthesis protein MviN/MurJ (putative lipid II flippase)